MAAAGSAAGPGDPAPGAVDRLLHQARVLDEWRFLEGARAPEGQAPLLRPAGHRKTLSAEVLAGALEVDLLVVTSPGVSKWIGETEKNLAEVFEVAESARAVLLFDEADALFGKRTEVSDATTGTPISKPPISSPVGAVRGPGDPVHEPPAEHGPGLCPEARVRGRLRGARTGERLALWRCHLPSVHPSHPMSIWPSWPPSTHGGGLIRNAAVAAAFLAASDGG